MNKFFKNCILLTTIALATPFASAQSLTANNVQGTVKYSFTQFGSPISGDFSKNQLLLSIPATLKDAKIEVAVALDSLSANSDEAKKEGLSKDWLNATPGAIASFKSTAIQKINANSYLARGFLQIKGKQQELQVPFTVSPTGLAQGSFSFKRSNFGVGLSWSDFSVIADDIKITFSFPLTQKP